MIPHLIHPVPIVINRLNQGATFYDEDAREPVQQAEHYASVTVPGQVKWTDSSRDVPQRGGIRETADGYVLFRKVDLDAASFMVKINDRISKLGGVDSDVYVNRVEWAGHYPDQGGPTLVKAYFEDRSPSKQTRG